MNWLLICGKNGKKTFEPLVKKLGVLLETITDITDINQENELREFLEEYNPHGVIIADSSYELALKLRKIKESLFLLFLSEISLKNSETIEKLLDNSIRVSENLNINEIPEIDDTRLKISEIRQKNEEARVASELAESEIEKREIKSTVDDKINVSLDTETLDREQFDAGNIRIVEEKSDKEYIKKSVNGHILIGLTELQHHIGCTHASFEIAEFLRQQLKDACVVLGDNRTYGSLSDYHKLAYKDSQSGFEINKIPVLPYNMLNVALKKYEYTVCDFGFMREEYRKNFGTADVKIMLCSAADWDLRVIMEYLNMSADGFKTDINYLFYPINQSRFIRFNKQFLRANCRAFRIQTSPDWTLPCKANRDVYAKILGLKNFGQKKKKFLGLF